MSERETVELLWQVFTAGSVPDTADPGTWRVGGRLLTLAELRRVRAATVDDWDGLGLLLQLRGDDLADEHARALARLHQTDGRQL